VPLDQRAIGPAGGHLRPGERLTPAGPQRLTGHLVPDIHGPRRIAAAPAGVDQRRAILAHLHGHRLDRQHLALGRRHRHVRPAAFRRHRLRLQMRHAVRLGQQGRRQALGPGNGPPGIHLPRHHPQHMRVQRPLINI
jgi:hypothetical protein